MSPIISRPGALMAPFKEMTWCFTWSWHYFISSTEVQLFLGRITRFFSPVSKNACFNLPPIQMRLSPLMKFLASHLGCKAGGSMPSLASIKVVGTLKRPGHLYECDANDPSISESLLFRVGQLKGLVCFWIICTERVWESCISVCFRCDAGLLSYCHWQHGTTVLALLTERCAGLYCVNTHRIT